MIQSAPIFFVRHGSTDWSFDQLFLGILDLPLNTKGINEVEATALKLVNLLNPIIIASPKKRTLETALLIGKKIKGEVIINDDLDARYYGNFSGDRGASDKYQSAMSNLNGDEDQCESLLPKDAEKKTLFDERVIKTFERIITEFSGKSIVIVSHGEVYRSLCRSLLSDNGLFIAKGDARCFYPSDSYAKGWRVESLHSLEVVP